MGCIHREMRLYKANKTRIRPRKNGEVERKATVITEGDESRSPHEKIYTEPSKGEVGDDVEASSKAETMSVISKSTDDRNEDCDDEDKTKCEETIALEYKYK